MPLHFSCCKNFSNCKEVENLDTFCILLHFAFHSVINTVILNQLAGKLICLVDL